jgi:hypothetical protein
MTNTLITTAVSGTQFMSGYGDRLLLSDNGSILNFGTWGIRSTGQYTDILIAGDIITNGYYGIGITNSTTISVSSTGYIYSAGADAIYSDIGSLGGFKIVNSGTIESSNGYAISSHYSNALTDTVENHGRIIGEVNLANGFNVFSNYGGTVIGGVNGGDGTDIFDSRGGTVTGSYYLGSGDDYFYLDTTPGSKAVEVFGGDGFDRLNLSSSTSAVWVDLEYSQMEVWTSRTGIANGANANTMIANIASFEQITGTAGSDVILGDSKDNTCIWTGNFSGVADQFVGRGGLDTIDLSNLKSVWIDLNLAANEVYTNGLSVAQGYNSNTVVLNLDSVERIIGTAGSDQIFGDANDNIFVSQGVAFDGQNYINPPVALALDRFDGRGGSDTIDLSINSSGAIWVDLTNAIEVWIAFGLNEATGATANTQIADLTNVENVIGVANKSDQFFGDGNANTYGYNGKYIGTELFDGRGGSDTFDGSRSDTSLWIGLQNFGMEVWTVNSTANSTGVNSNTQVCDLISVENLIGSQYGDTLIGYTDNNRIEGGKGDDILVGYGGNDTFVFKFDTVNSQGAGNDVINDFSAGAGLGDVIELTGFSANYNSFAEIMAVATNTGAGVHIDYGVYGNGIDILGITKSQLAADDFVFL